MHECVYTVTTYVFNVLLPVQFIYGIQVHIHHCSTPGGVLPGIILYGSTPGTTHMYVSTTSISATATGYIYECIMCGTPVRSTLV